MKRAVLLLLSSIVFCQTTAAEHLKVAVASNFLPAFKSILDDAEPLDFEVKISTASSGVLFAQISHGAPFDVFLSADSERPRLLEKNKLISAGSRKSYAMGQLALWSPQQSSPDISLLLNQHGRLAIANPRFAPYGVSARQWLEYKNGWQALTSRLVKGNNAAQAFQFVDTGNAAWGLVPLSLLKGAYARQTSSKYLNYRLLPSSEYSLIDQQLVVLARSTKQHMAERLVALMLSTRAQALLPELGYLPPQGTDK